MSVAKGQLGLTAAPHRLAEQFPSDQPLIGAGHWRVASAEEHQSNDGFSQGRVTAGGLPNENRQVGTHVG